MTLAPDVDRADLPMETHLGPFAASAPGLGYPEYLREFDEGAEMWRQVVPGQHGRGLALGRWGLHMYEEFGDLMEALMADDDPMWVPMLVEWEAVTVMDGLNIKPDPGYLEVFHSDSSYFEGGEDALPMVSIRSTHSSWPELIGPWSLHNSEGFFFWEYLDGQRIEPFDVIAPVNHVLPIEDDDVLSALSQTIAELGHHWPMDECGPTTFVTDWGGEDQTHEMRINALRAGHNESCISKSEFDIESLECQWDHEARLCQPCGGGPHILAVANSFIDALPYERFCFDPILVPYWDRLKDRNERFYHSLLETLETERTKGRSWYYSFSRRWSPWAHSSQVPARHRV